MGSEMCIRDRAQDTFLSSIDQQVAKEALKQFKKQGLDIKLKARVSGTDIKRNLVNVSYEDTKGTQELLSLIHISEPTRPLYISYAVFCLKKVRGRPAVRGRYGAVGWRVFFF